MPKNRIAGQVSKVNQIRLVSDQVSGVFYDTPSSQGIEIERAMKKKPDVSGQSSIF